MSSSTALGQKLYSVAGRGSVEGEAFQQNGKLGCVSGISDTERTVRLLAGDGGLKKWSVCSECLCVSKLFLSRSKPVKDSKRKL